MKKMTTLFLKNFDNLSMVTTELDPENSWALEVGIPTEKFDGTACAVIDGLLYKRYDCKKGKIPPEGSIPCQDPDPITGHWPHWVPCTSKPEDKWHWEGYYNQPPFIKDATGTYELVGPKVNGNKYGLKDHYLFKHGGVVIDQKFTGYEDIKLYLESHNIEGIVFHHPVTGQMCKIRRCDFGFSWK